MEQSLKLARDWKGIYGRTEQTTPIVTQCDCKFWHKVVACSRDQVVVMYDGAGDLPGSYASSDHRSPVRPMSSVRVAIRVP
jgi:hypothetical protein